MKSLLLLTGMLALAVLPANAGVSISFRSGSFHGGFSSGGFSGGRCSYYANCYGPGYRSCGYVGYPIYAYGGYGYYYGAYTPSYDSYSYAPVYQPIAVPPPQPQPQAPATPAPAAASTPAPAPAPMEYGILDVNGFVHSPYSDAIFKVPGVRNAQVVYDPVTGKPFLVR